MEEKDKTIQLDDPLDEEIIELNDEVSDVPDDEEIIEISDFADTSPTENEGILDLTETADISSDEDDDIIDLTDTVEDYTEKDEEVIELNDVDGEPFIKEEEILDIDNVEGESPAEDEEISETGYVTEETALDEEKIPELYKTVEEPAEPEKTAIEPEDLAVETSFEEEIEDIVDDIPAEDEDIIKSTELGSKTESPELYDSNDDDPSADLDSELEEETIVIDELDSDDLDGEINIEFDDPLSGETAEFSSSEALSMNEEPTVLLDEEPVKEEPVEPEIKAIEPEDLAVETSFEEEIEDIVDDAPAKDEDIIKSAELGSETDRSGFSDSSDDDLSADTKKSILNLMIHCREKPLNFHLQKRCL